MHRSYQGGSSFYAIACKRKPDDDYLSIEQVQQYDDMHQRFRHYEKDSDAIINSSNWTQTTQLSIWVQEPAHSHSTLRNTTRKSTRWMYLPPSWNTAGKKKGLRDEAFERFDCPRGFLTYEHEAEPTDAMVSIAALHHLSDFWKLVTLTRAAGMLKTGERLFLFDIIFPSAAEDLDGRLDAWVISIAKQS